MATTVPLVDTAGLAALRDGHEETLERLFRERYGSLTEAAASNLGEPARAARAVERAFLDLWDALGQLTTPEAAERFLDGALADAVAVQRRRAASLRRFEAFEDVHGHAAGTTPDVDASWDRVRAGLNPMGAAESVAVMRAQAKHHAAEHLAAVGRRRTPWFAVLGTVALGLAVIAGLFWIPARGRSPDRSAARALSSSNARDVVTQNGQRGSLRLGDGTNVSLGAGTMLTVPPGFAARLRAVKLVGSATFEPVAGERPFSVHAGDVIITATGTVFDVTAYPGERTVAVRVREGTVEIAAADARQAVRAGRSVLVTGNGEISAASRAAAEERFGWIDGEVVIAGRTLGEALPILQRWYGLTLTPQDKALLDRPVTMRASVDSMRAAIRELQQSAKVLVDYDGKRNRVWDGGHKP
jgi:ferric-dicitrate binding protein FerR (iron transport regulator)